MSFSIFWICSSSNPASTSCFFCSSVSLNSVVFSDVSAVASVVVADLGWTADFFATEEVFARSVAFVSVACVVSVDSTASSLGCATFSAVLASVDSKASTVFVVGQLFQLQQR